MALLSGLGARMGWLGGRGGNSDNEGGRAVCKQPRRGGGLLLVPGGHGSGWVAVGRAGRGVAWCVVRGAVVLWFCGAVVVWWCGSVVLWCCGAVVRGAGRVV